MKRIYNRFVRRVRQQVTNVRKHIKHSPKSRSVKKIKKITIKRRGKKEKRFDNYIFDPNILHALPFQIIKQDGSVQGKIPALKPAQILEMYKWMVLARAFDNRCIKLHRQGRLGTYASILGQEASQVGSAFALQNDDWLVPSFRENASCLVRGMQMKSILQYWGGDERGHTDPKVKRILPLSIPIGTQDVHGVGIAMAIQYKGEHAAVLACMGDGGTSEGDFHEALNFAGVFRAPVVFLCTNNQWAISVPRAKQTHSKTLAQKALAYGFEGLIVDGNDILAVYKVVSEALEKARKGNGPTLIECITYRMGDHTTADDQRRYRNQKEVAEWAKKDPIDRLRNYMVKKNMWDKKKERALQEEIVGLVSDAVKTYEEDSLPNPKDMFAHAFASMNAQLQEQQDELIETIGNTSEKRIIEKIEGGFP